jgi:hypothetical protein
METVKSPNEPDTPVRRGSRRRLLLSIALAAGSLSACDWDTSGPGEPIIDPPGPGSVAMTALGLGAVSDRYTSELWVRGGVAYTGTWGQRGGRRGNVLHVWDVRSATPVRIRSVEIAGDSVSTLGDVQLSDDGRLLFVATEPAPNGSLRIFDLADPANPILLSVFRPSGSANGVHTAEIARVNGTLYGFLSIDPSPSRLVVVDLSDPANPREILSRVMGSPFVHDVFVRDGILFTALWNEGLTIWDIGGRGAGSPSDPVQIGNVRTVGGQVHNVWWYHAADGSRRYAFLGEEGPGSIGSSASGDLHVVDVSDLANPREVAFFSVAGAGAHNFTMDESRGILYAAFYNGGVRALDVKGDLGQCANAARAADGRCNLGAMGREVGHGLVGGTPTAFVWGVQWLDGSLFASDMVNGLYRLDPSGVSP